jgi:ATP synthase F1 complex assembly factor 2
LDQRKLRTPSGSVLKVTSEPLALMIANEWNSQSDKIQLSNMHLTALANTSQDNPLRLEKQQMIDAMLEHLTSDTISFRIREPEGNQNRQFFYWHPSI